MLRQIWIRRIRCTVVSTVPPSSVALNCSSSRSKRKIKGTPSTSLIMKAIRLWSCWMSYHSCVCECNRVARLWGPCPVPASASQAVVTSARSFSCNGANAYSSSAFHEEFLDPQRCLSQRIIRTGASVVTEIRTAATGRLRRTLCDIVSLRQKWWQ